MIGYPSELKTKLLDINKKMKFMTSEEILEEVIDILDREHLKEKSDCAVENGHPRWKCLLDPVSNLQRITFHLRVDLCKDDRLDIGDLEMGAKFFLLTVHFLRKFKKAAVEIDNEQHRELIVKHINSTFEHILFIYHRNTGKTVADIENMDIHELRDNSLRIF